MKKLLKRASKSLCPLGLQEGTFRYQKTLPDRLNWWKEIEGAFLWVSIAFQGKYSEVVYAIASASLLRLVNYSFLREERLLTELAADKSRGWTEYRTDEGFDSWLSDLVGSLPKVESEVNSQMSPRLLERYDRLIPVFERYSTRATKPEFLQVARERRPESAEVADRYVVLTRVDGAIEAYVDAVACVLEAQAEIEGVEQWDERTHPLEDEDFMMRVQYVADRLLSARLLK